MDKKISEIISTLPQEEGLIMKNYISLLESQSRTDSLTGLYNLRRFEEDFSQQLKISAREHARKREYYIGLIMADIDHFKRINDSLGHLGGDLVLKETANYLRKSVKAGDFVYRIGGEEFLILAPNTSFEEGIFVAERLRKNFGRAIHEGLEKELKKEIGEKAKIENITASFGISVSTGEQSLNELKKAVDKALYCSKDNGRNSTSVYLDGRVVSLSEFNSLNNSNF